ncbi:HAD-IB family hydrolase [Leptotrichia sp. OH3620_COT-345]|nr:HAD-IB family hydrolase [Leptotrichia sp. OH3620_COT-345]
MKKDIIVYDFDKTIYGGESGTNFFTYYFKKYHVKASLFFLLYLRYVFLYLIKIIDLKRLKEKFYVFLEKHSEKEIQQIIDDFWTVYSKEIYEWTGSELEKNKKEAELVIVSSATPLFLIEKFLLSVGYDVVFGTDFKKGKKGEFVAEIDGENNKGIEKVKKLNKWAKENNIDYNIVKFYSDSLADKPLFDIAEKKYWIKKGEKVEGMPDRKTIIDILFWK